MTLPLLQNQNNKYKPEYAEMAYKLAILGLTNQQIADVFDVSLFTLDEWTKKHDDFGWKLNSGRSFADADVAIALHKKATGYRKKVAKAHFDDNVGQWATCEYEEEVEPNLQAIITWLGLRQRKNEVWAGIRTGTLEGQDFDKMVSDKQPNTEQGMQAWQKMIGK